MEGSAQQFIENSILRPARIRRHRRRRINNDATKHAFTFEMPIVCLKDDTKELIMKTLRAIYGQDFTLNNPNVIEEHTNNIVQQSYWNDRDMMVIQNVETFIKQDDENSAKTQLRRLDILRIKQYGFPLAHSIEAYDYCNGDLRQTLALLYRKYLNLTDEPEELNDLLSPNTSEADLLALRRDEKAALESIYNNLFEEKVSDTIWSLRFKIEDLLFAHNASLNKIIKNESVRLKAGEATAAAAGTSKMDAKKKISNRCRCFEEYGFCRFGKKCRFQHIRGEETAAESELRRKMIEMSNSKDFNCLFLEIYFPPGTRYPYEAPFIFLKTESPNIPGDLILKIARRLYLRACELCNEGVPCVFTISENLQSDAKIIQNIHKDFARFPDPEKSIFYIPVNNIVLIDGLPVTKVLTTAITATATTTTATATTTAATTTTTTTATTTATTTKTTIGIAAQRSSMQRTSLEREHDNRAILRKYLERLEDDRFRPMLQSRFRLPAYIKMPEILELINRVQVVIICGETGCGKSTQIPQFLLDEWLEDSAKKAICERLSNIEIVCCQQHRLATIGVAERVAEERIERLGQTVGYQVRHENKISINTRLIFCTTNILLKRMVTDPLLNSVTHIIIDEVHERRKDCDFLLMLLRNVLKERSDLKLILMSTTMNAKLFSEYFDNATIFEIPGRIYPVQQMFLEEIIERCDYVIEYDSMYARTIVQKDHRQLMHEVEYSGHNSAQTAPPTRTKDEMLTLTSTYARYKEYSKKTCKTIYLMEPMCVNTELIVSVLRFIVDGVHTWSREGSIIVFLPGKQEIQLLYEQLCDNIIFSARADRFIILPLHSDLSSDEQAAIFRPIPTGKRKLILTTSMAETSVTIEDCTFVLDCGLKKIKYFDTNHNRERLRLQWISKANVMQRRQHAGHFMPGVCIHLFTSNRFEHHLTEQPIPEIHRIPLEPILLKIKILPKVLKKSFSEVLRQVIEAPKYESIRAAVRRLQDVDALDKYENLTPLGHHLASLPVDVHIGKLLIFGAVFQCLDSILTIAAFLSVGSPFIYPLQRRNDAERCHKRFATANSDQLTCLTAYNQWLAVAKRSAIASRNFANENFLSLQTLKQITDAKYENLRLLISAGFVSVHLPRKRRTEDDNILDITGADINKNSKNNSLIIALLCGALYPNIVQILRSESIENEIENDADAEAVKETVVKQLFKFKTHNDGVVTIHQSSSTHDMCDYPSPFLMFQERVETTRISVRDCTVLPVMSLILFSGSMLAEEEDDNYFFKFDNDWIIIKAKTYEEGEMLKSLRLELHKLLEEKIRDPNLNLLKHKNGQEIINAIIHLVTNY